LAFYSHDDLAVLDALAAKAATRRRPLNEIGKLPPRGVSLHALFSATKPSWWCGRMVFMKFLLVRRVC